MNILLNTLMYSKRKIVLMAPKTLYSTKFVNPAALTCHSWKERLISIRRHHEIKCLITTSEVQSKMFAMNTTKLQRKTLILLNWNEHKCSQGFRTGCYILYCFLYNFKRLTVSPHFWISTHKTMMN